MRIGQGYDIHRFREDGEGILRLGGVHIEGAPQLEGHSDGDALMHAVIDAILGAAGAGDIGQHFPPGAEDTADIDSRELLQRAFRLIAARSYRVVNIDATVIAERPRLADYIPAMREAIARTLDLGPDAVNVKATTAEGLGPIGAGEAVAALAVALVDDAGA
jgi:2-C-methyl-D-erythritol 2,4-cyclodiphosphate synthase